jgi:hypothetical protein
MRRRSAGVKAAARIALISQVVACSRGARQSSAWPLPPRAVDSSVARRPSVSGSIACSQPASASSRNSSWNSAAPSSVSGVAGRKRSARRSPISPPRSRRAVKPKSASRAARSVSRQKRPSSATMRSRGCRVALQHVQQVLQAQHRPGGLAAVGVAVGLPVAQPFEQPHQPQVALGAAGLRVGSVQQRRQVPGGGRHAAARGWRVGGRINAARRCRPAQTRAPGSRTSGRLR